MSAVVEQHITERRTAAERDALLAAIVASSSDAMVSFDPTQGKIVTWNAAAERMFGYTETQAIGSPVGLLVPPELAVDEPTGVYARALRGVPVISHETVRLARNGRRIQVSLTATRMISSDGRLIGVSAIFRDITRRKCAEDELRAKEASLRDLLDTLDLATVFIRDLEGTIRFWSGGCERMFGWSSAEAVGQLAQDLLATRFPLPRAEIQATLQHESHWQGHLISKCRDGTEIVTSVRKVLRHEAGSVTVMETLTDVTAQRQVEAKLRESEARFRTMTEAMPQMIWSARPDGSHDYFNARWYEFTGLSEEGGDGKAWGHLIHPDDRECLNARWQQSLQTGEPFEFEFRLRRIDGSYSRVLARAIPVRDDFGAILRWLGSSTDIEEIAVAREVVARDRAELERLVQERTRELDQAQARLAHAQRMEALGQLAGGIAHDFNNVLQAMQGGAALIERKPDNPETVRRVARMMAETAERGSAITRRLLAFSRRGDLRAEPIDTELLLDSLREILAHSLGTGIRVIVAAQPGISPLLADRGQLETVLVNLATNGRDAMVDGGQLALSADFGEGRNRPEQLEAGCWIRVAVTDDGSGMSPQVLARASEPFFTTKPQGKGTGLGLAMAKGFAEQSGGALQIESEPGRGTTVALWLPAAEQSALGRLCERVEPSPMLATAGHPKILLVDDHEILRELLAEQLEELGYEVTQAASGEQAVALLDRNLPFDLMVTDLSMPGMDGVATIREAQRRRGRIPVVLLTGYAGDAAALAIGREIAGAFSLLRKPVEARHLAERMAMLLEATRIGSYRKT
ncbi:MAG: PAS domain S-box protein [Janthinobacterium lividum]